VNPEAWALARTNLIEALRDFVRWQRGGQALDQDGVLLATGARPFPVGFFNSVARWDRSVSAREVLERAEAWFAPLGRGFTVFVLDDDDADLEAEARARGLQEVASAPWMVCEKPVPQSQLPDDYELRLARDERAIDDAGRISGEAYEAVGLPAAEIAGLYAAPQRLLRPGLEIVIAYRLREPLASAMAIASEGVTGIYWVGTRRFARRRGLAEACTRCVTNRGLRGGARFAVLQATPMGESVYRKIGFETVGEVRWYLCPPVSLLP